jgi:hypothetical protein
MDFSKGFLTEINLIGDKYLWTQKMDYEKIVFRCRACFDTGHLAVHLPRGPKKYQKQWKPTWWVGSHIDHQLISKEDPIDAVPPKEVPKGDPLFPSDVDSPDLDPPLEVSKFEIEDKKVTTKINEQSKIHQETPQKLEEKVVSTSLDLGNETHVLPSSISLVSWADEADEVEASEKSNPPDQGNEGMEGLVSTPLSLNVGWMVA